MFVFHNIIFKVSPYYQFHIYRGNQCYSMVVILNLSTAKKHSFLQWQWMCSLLYITIWFTVTIYSYLKKQWILYFLRRCFSFLYHCHDFYRTWLYIWFTQCVSYGSKICVPFTSTRVHPHYLVAFALLIFLVYCIVFCFVSFLCYFFPK